jgi:hypothetical protein
MQRLAGPRRQQVAATVLESAQPLLFVAWEAQLMWPVQAGFLSVLQLLHALQAMRLEEMPRTRTRRQPGQLSDEDTLYNEKAARPVQISAQLRRQVLLRQRASRVERHVVPLLTGSSSLRHPFSREDALRPGGMRRPVPQWFRRQAEVSRLNAMMVAMARKGCGGSELTLPPGPAR